MLKKGMLVAGALMLATSVVNIPTVQAETKVEVIQDAEGRKILERFLSSGFAIKFTPTFGSIKYDKSKGEIIATDVGFAVQGMKANYKKITVSGYQEDKSTGDYTIGKLVLGELSGTIESKNIKVPNTATPPIASAGFAIDQFEYSGIAGSYNKGTMSVENATGSGMKLLIPNAPDLTNMKISMSGMKIKNLKKMAELQQKMTVLFQSPLQPGAPMPPEMIEYMTLIYSSMSWEKASISGFPEFPAPDGSGSFKFGEFYLGKFADGIADEITMKEMSVSKPNDPAVTDIKIGKFSILGFDILGLIKYSATITANTPPTPEQGAKFIQFVKGLSVNEVQVKGPAQEITGNLDVSWDQFIGLFPTKIDWKSHSIITAPNDAPEAAGYPAFLKMAGLDKLDIKSSMGINWDQKTNRITIKPFAYDAQKLAEVEFSASIGNVTKEMLEERDMGRLGVLAMGATVGTITLKVNDKGAQKLADETTKGMWGAMSAEFATDPKLQPVIQNITNLLNEPGGKLTITLKPKGEMSFAQVSGAIVLGPKMLPTLFDIETSFEK